MRIVFCGGCNPVIDRVALADELSADPALDHSPPSIAAARAMPPAQILSPRAL